MSNSWTQLALGTRLALGVSISALAITMAPPSAIAQVTTSGVRGTVMDASGMPGEGAIITVTDTRTGIRRSTVTSAGGQFDMRNLEVGGPYTVQAEKAGEQPTLVNNVLLNLGQVTDLTLSLTGAQAAEQVVVSASRQNTAQVAMGPSASFDLDTLENAPASNRDIKDIIRMDPRVYMDEAFVDAISCAGASPRFNSLTVDGVRLNDDFGLNSNGYPTERMPFSYDAIRQVSVELAPFDVQYGSFTACNINAVTKSGSNEFHGSAFFDYTSSGLTGHKTAGIRRGLGDFDEKRYGVTLGGPIIPDKLFFFAAYEKFDGANIFGKTPADVGLTNSAYQQVIDTAVNKYGYVSGGLPNSIPVFDEKMFARVDWNIMDGQRAVFTYNADDGSNYSGSDSSSDQIPDGNHYYERGAKLHDFTAALYSDWTDNFSTEAHVSYLSLNNRQNPRWTQQFSEIQVRVPNSLGGSTTVYLGPDDSRHANKLKYNLWNFKFAGNYRWNGHTITGGFERENYKVFNLFVQQAFGEYHFSSPTDFANGDFNFYQYTNAAGTNNVNDGAANFGYQMNTVYVQDEWAPIAQLDIVAGLRYDWYTSDDHPAANAAFKTKYGFSNSANMDGRGIAQPRVGFTYDLENGVQLHGGAGLFSGGNPNVWISNNYSNNGVTLADYYAPAAMMNLSNFTYGGDGRPFYNVPTQAIAAIASAKGAGGVNALDPNFKIPSDWKFALGAVWDYDSENPWIGDNWRIYADFLYSMVNEAATVIPLSYTKTGTAPDGRPIYGGSTADFLLTNTSKGAQQVWSIAIQKRYENGIDWTLGYAHTDATDVNPMTSSVAYSNFTNFSASNPVNPGTATSDYQIEHRFTGQFNWEKTLLWDRPTRLSLFGTLNSGAPYSYTFAYNNMFESAYKGSRQLAYIPSGVNDPLLSPASNAAAVQSLVNYVNGNGVLKDYAGGISKRNIGTDDWWGKIDLRLSQQFPGVGETDSFEGFFVINNLTNLINDKWGVLREHGFPGNAELYNATISGGKYNISSFNAGADKQSISVTPSLWQIHIGVSYKF